MEITTDIYLRGSNWRKALDMLSPFFPQSLQPNYSLFAIGIAIGIMYDKQENIAGEETAEEKENKISVPRTVLHPHNNDLDFLFQTAILTSNLVKLTEKERLELAFSPDCKIEFNKFDFLSKFANYGIGVLLQKITDDPIETMENIKTFIASTVEGYNYEIFSVAASDELDVEDLE